MTETDKHADVNENCQPAEQLADVASTTPGFENMPGSDMRSPGNNVSVVAEDTVEQTFLAIRETHVRKITVIVFSVETFAIFKFEV